MMEFINLLKSHSSVRSFTDQPVAEDLLKEIVLSAQSASTSSFIQAYTIIHVKNAEKKKAIAHLAGDQPYIEECPVFLVFCADLNRLAKACEMNNTEMQKGYTESFILSTVDTALAAQNSIIAAESLGLGGVYIGGIRNNPSEITKLLKLPQDVYPVFGMCLGYPAVKNECKNRLPLEIILKEDEYSNENEEKLLSEYDSSISSYYRERTAGQRNDTWTGQMSMLLSRIPRPHMKKFLEEQGFNMK